jgi:outer membrane protein TolC
LTEAATASKEAERLSRALYTSGNASFLDVLEAQRTSYAAEQSLIDSRVTLASQFIALNKALGGGWLKPVDVERPAVIDEETGPRLRIIPVEAPQP